MQFYKEMKDSLKSMATKTIIVPSPDLELFSIMKGISKTYKLLDENCLDEKMRPLRISIDDRCLDLPWVQGEVEYRDGTVAVVGHTSTDRWSDRSYHDDVFSFTLYHGKKADGVAQLHCDNFQKNSLKLSPGLIGSERDPFLGYLGGLKVFGDGIVLSGNTDPFVSYRVKNGISNTAELLYHAMVGSGIIQVEMSRDVPAPSKRLEGRQRHVFTIQYSDSLAAKVKESFREKITYASMQPLRKKMHQ